MTARLTVVIPTLNERGNVDPLLERLRRTLAGVDWEAIFVDDDSSDGTAERLREIAETDARVRCLQRIGRRGLAGACIEGMLASSAPYLAVMDADMQHDETLLPRMIETLIDDDLDLVIGSRYTRPEDLASLSDRRRFASRCATRLGRAIIGAELTDPMSGFFMLKRRLLDRTKRRLTGKGFKILLDIIASTPGELRYREIPYTFRGRLWGESKLDTLVVWEYFVLLAEKLLGKVLPARFMMFAVVGGLGVMFHLVVLALLHRSWGLAFPYSQALATLFVMAINFYLNNVFTHRDLRLRGWRMLQGWLFFSLLCGVGAAINLAIATHLHGFGVHWIVAGFVGVTIGGVFNYVATLRFAWQLRQNRSAAGERMDPARPATGSGRDQSP
ncbi:MAG: glycosyltransferase family 2 protein [Vicinamibacteria bacterium]|nr:glycosyltransferase family 2 protein [Vicinamibacteria bacterium]